MTLHSHFPRNARVLFIFSDGKQCVDSWVEGKSKWFVLKRTGRVPRRGVRSITVYRGEGTTDPQE